jgi:glycosyltransferase involved in cell wall biosynthesis
MKDPIVSVIIPTYNRAYLIERAIQSVLNQTYHNFEIIIVDDGSTDNTEEVIKKFLKYDKRINYIKYEKNKGGSAARNTGIKAARGEYIAFQDSDDEWFSEKLEKQMRVFENVSSEVGVVYTGFWRIEDKKKKYIPSDKISHKEGNIHNELLEGNFVGMPTVIIRKECFEKVGMFDENLPRLQDWELIIRLSKYYDFKCIDEPLLVSYYISDSISSNNEALHNAFEIILIKHFNFFIKNKKLLSKYYYNLGIDMFLKNDNFKKGKDCLIKSFKVYPYNIKHFFIVGLMTICNIGFFVKVMKFYYKKKKNIITKFKMILK